MCHDWHVGPNKTTDKISSRQVGQCNFSVIRSIVTYGPNEQLSKVLRLVANIRDSERKYYWLLKFNQIAIKVWSLDEHKCKIVKPMLLHGPSSPISKTYQRSVGRSVSQASQPVTTDRPHKRPRLQSLIFVISTMPSFGQSVGQLVLVVVSFVPNPKALMIVKIFMVHSYMVITNYSSFTLCPGCDS